MRTVLETERLVLREFVPEDAPFVLALLNSDGWLRHIGDRNVRTEAQAVKYLQDRLMPSYAQHGFGLYAVARKDTRELLGMCGLIRRDTLPAPDLGFAFLPEHEGQGYAHEAAAAALRHGFEALGMARILAITLPGNERSLRLLRKLGFADAGPHQAGGEALMLLARGP